MPNLSVRENTSVSGDKCEERKELPESLLQESMPLQCSRNFYIITRIAHDVAQ